MARKVTVRRKDTVLSLLRELVTEVRGQREDAERRYQTFRMQRERKLDYAAERTARKINTYATAYAAGPDIIDNARRYKALLDSRKVPQSTKEFIEDLKRAEDAFGSLTVRQQEALERNYERFC